MCSKTRCVCATQALVCVSELILRYAVRPISSSSPNATAKPSAILLPKVHISSLLGRAENSGPVLDCLQHRSDAEDWPDAVCDTGRLMDVHGARAGRGG